MSEAIAALLAFRIRLKESGDHGKAMVVARCVEILRGLAK